MLVRKLILGGTGGTFIKNLKKQNVFISTARSSKSTTMNNFNNNKSSLFVELNMKNSIAFNQKRFMSFSHLETSVRAENDKEAQNGKTQSSQTTKESTTNTTTTTSANTDSKGHTATISSFDMFSIGIGTLINRLHRVFFVFLFFSGLFQKPFSIEFQFIVFPKLSLILCNLFRRNLISMSVSNYFFVFLQERNNDFFFFFF